MAAPLESFYTTLVSQYLEPRETAYLILHDIVQFGQVLNLKGIMNPNIYIRKLPHNTIRELTLSHCELTSKELRRILRHQQRIDRLDVAWNNLDTLPPLPDLTHLNLLRNRHFSGAGLSRYPELTFLNVELCELTEAGVREIQTLSHLHTLLLDIPESMMNQPFTGNFVNLRVLRLDMGSDISLTKIHRFAELEYISLVSGNMTDHGITFLQTLPYLRLLNVPETPLNGVTLQRLTGLTHLNLAHGGIMNYNYLRHLVNLRALAIDDERPEGEQDLDPNLSFLAPLTHLQYLDLNNALISEQGFTVLSRLPLKFLQLAHVTPTPEAMKSLTAISTLEVLHLIHGVLNPIDLSLLRPPQLSVLSIYTEEPILTNDTVEMLFGLHLSSLNTSLESEPLTEEGITKLIQAGVISDHTRIHSDEDHVSVYEYLTRYPVYQGDIMTFFRSRWSSVV